MLYPVPAQNWISISLEDRIYQVLIFDLLGNKVLEQTTTGDYKEENIKVENLEPGRYVIKVKTDNSIYSESFLKL